MDTHKIKVGWITAQNVPNPPYSERLGHQQLHTAKDSDLIKYLI